MEFGMVDVGGAEAMENWVSPGGAGVDLGSWMADQNNCSEDH